MRRGNLHGPDTAGHGGSARRLPFIACLALAGVATGVLGCEKEETPPEPMIVGSGERAEGDAPAPTASGEPASDADQKCTPKAGEVCFSGAEVEHAAVLIHHATGANVVVVGSYDKRIDGAISIATPAGAFGALAQQAELAHREIGGVHYLGAKDVIARATGAAANFCPTTQSMVLQRTDPQSFTKLAVEHGGRRLQGTIEGEITVAVSNVNTCVIAQHVVNMSTGQGRVDAKALRIRGDATVPKSPRASGAPCAALDSQKELRQPCHSNEDLAVVGTAKIGEANVALVRRTARIYEPVALVKPGDHVGDYQQEVGVIDGTGVKSVKGATIISWAP